MNAFFCAHCGQPAAHEPAQAGGSTPWSVHARCGERLAMEPPRYCAECGRRMKVQVTPLGWSAECSRHGSLTP
ncbi:hypothetical protein [Sinomonas sp. ASV322]|uniref:biotin synthase auxiliary protein BsaP n=1 Tax=Sinomonas sp. ASV322 TaxID=3041920 RepID=UPI0027DE2DDC|nr:hypothetical protein [Sinomonas sp. ASV322]MDQ4504375.1 hypothetical protein [Sinomonas sp. ASV322]